jgi:hypothetical protein
VKSSYRILHYQWDSEQIVIVEGSTTTSILEIAKHKCQPTVGFNLVLRAKRSNKRLRGMSQDIKRINFCHSNPIEDIHHRVTASEYFVKIQIRSMKTIMKLTSNSK